jgi:hypothetical protein
MIHIMIPVTICDSPKMLWSYTQLGVKCEDPHSEVLGIPSLYNPSMSFSDLTWGGVPLSGSQLNHYQNI